MTAVATELTGVLETAMVETTALEAAELDLVGLTTAEDEMAADVALVTLEVDAVAAVEIADWLTDTAPLYKVGPGMSYVDREEYILIRIPGSVSLYNAVPSTPDGLSVPLPVTSILMHCG